MPAKVWNGTSWVEFVPKVWNGTSYANIVAGKVWDGSSWVQFYPSVKLTDNSAENLSLAGVGGTATATYRLNSSGQASATNLAGVLTNITGEWLVTGSSSSDYEVNGIWGSGGGSAAGPIGWVSLGTTRDYTLTATNNYATRDLTLQIRTVSTSLILATATITFEVDSAP